MTGDGLDEVVERLGLDSADRATLRAALTHPSYSREHGGADYERLEFLGDAVLGAAVAEHLYREFPDAPEGDLTRMKVALTSGKTLAEVARALGLDSVLLVGRGAVRDASRDSVLENALEAVVGAVALEAGLDAAREFVVRLLDGRLDAETLLAGVTDPKNRLQELLQGRGLGLPTYEITGETGPAHMRTFAAAASLDGQVLGTGEGPSKQEAQRAAAASALEALEASRTDRH